MNPNIGLLAKAPRGAKWRSRLVRFDQDIRHMREAGKTYKEIAAWLGDQGLCITASAVHAYVRVRALRGAAEYRLPATSGFQALAPQRSNGEAFNRKSVTEPATPHAPKIIEEFIYIPPENCGSKLQDEDFGISDPSNHNANL